MKVLMLNGSARANGNTFTALTEIGKQNGIPLPDAKVTDRTHFIR